MSAASALSRSSRRARSVVARPRTTRPPPPAGRRPSTAKCSSGSARESNRESVNNETRGMSRSCTDSRAFRRTVRPKLSCRITLDLVHPGNVVATGSQRSSGAGIGVGIGSDSSNRSAVRSTALISISSAFVFGSRAAISATPGRVARASRSSRIRLSSALSSTLSASSRLLLASSSVRWFSAARSRSVTSVSDDFSSALSTRSWSFWRARLACDSSTVLLRLVDSLFPSASPQIPRPTPTTYRKMTADLPRPARDPHDQIHEATPAKTSTAIPAAVKPTLTQPYYAYFLAFWNSGSSHDDAAVSFQHWGRLGGFSEQLDRGA